MRKKRKTLRVSIIFIISSILAISAFNTYLCKNKGSVDLFNEILNKTNAQVIKYGLITSFHGCGNYKEECRQLLSQIEPKVEVKEKLYGETYCLEFKNDTTEGYIQSRKDKDNNIITINITCLSNTNELEKLKKKVQNSINTINESSKNKFFCYVKSKINENDLSLLNKEVMEYLKQKGAKNLQSIKLDNGYSTICDTGMYNYIQANGNLIDFNYSICKYDSGNYLIIGTPQIILDY